MKKDTPLPSSSNNEEIDLAQLFNMFKRFVNRMFIGFLYLFLFVKKNIVLLLVLVIVGLGIGYLLEKPTTIVYQTEAIVTPNFNSLNYLESRINNIQNNLTSNPAEFSKVLQVQPEDLEGFSVALLPINKEVVENSKLQFFKDYNSHTLGGLVLDQIDNELIKELTQNFKVLFTYTNENTGELVSRKILDLLNENDYYKDVRDTHKTLLKERILKNTSIIAEIDTLVSNYSNALKDSKAELSKIHSGNQFYYENKSNMRVETLIELRTKLIDNNEYSKRLLIEQQETIKILYLGSKQKLSKKNYPNMMLITPLLMLGFFFGFILLKYLNQKSQEI